MLLAGTLPLADYLPPALAPLPLIQTLAAPLCFNDAQGANDESGQKDLTRTCIDTAGLPNTIAVNWQWDDTGTSGANTLNACALFDSDGDGLANNAVCVNTNNNPAVMTSFVVYSCSDTKNDRCSGPTTLFTGPPTTANGTTCSVAQAVNANPFSASNTDTRASCTIDLDDVGGTLGTLEDVCSYPSNSPNSSASDCVYITADAGKLEVRKALSPITDTGMFTVSITGQASATGGNGATTGEKVLDTGTYSVGEAAVSGTSLADYTKSIECRNLNGTGSVIASTTSATSLNVSVSDQSDIVCVITNTKKARIVVQKQTEVNNETQQFTFSLTGPNSVNQSFALADNGSRDSGYTYDPGTGYSVGETLPAGWEQNGITCTSSLTGTETPTNIGLTAGETVTCVFNNKRIPNGSVTINKVAIGGAASFAFSGPAPFGNFALSTANNYQQTFASVPSSTYTINEGALAGWDLSSITCSDPTNNSTVNLTSGVITVAVALAESVNCTFTNVKRGTIIVDKQTLPAADPQSFAFTTAGAGYSGFSLTDAAAPNAQAVIPGTYGVAESLPSGWDQTSASCSDGSPIGAIVVSAGETITCTFGNTKRSTLTLVKDIAPVPGFPVADQFNLLINDNAIGGPYDDNGSTGAQSFAGGSTQSIAEAAAGAAVLADYTSGVMCVDGTYNSNNGTVALPPGAAVTCTFLNTRNSGALEVRKALSPTNDPGKFNLEIVDVASAANQGDNGTTGEKIVPTGSYTVRETAGSGTQLQDYNSAIACRAGNGAGAVVASAADTTVDVSVTAGSDIVCALSNTRKTGGVTFVKVVQGDLDGIAASPSNWHFDVDNGGPQGVPHNGTRTINTGIYTVLESSSVAQDNADYALSGASGACAFKNGNISLEVSEVASTCTLTNTRKTGALEVRKILVPANDPHTFSLAIDGVIRITGGDNATSGEVALETGAHSIAESAGPNTSMSDYLASLSCIDQANGGAAVDATAGSVNITAGSDIQCTYTNIRSTTMLALTKIANVSRAVPGRLVTYTISIQNTGVINASNVIVSDPAPAGLTLDSVTPSQGACVTFPCDLGIIAPGDTATIEAVFAMPADYSGANPVVNTASATSTEVPNIDPDSASLPVQTVADIGVEKNDGVPTYTPGSPVTYRITVTNNGPSDAAGIFVNDDKPAQITDWTWTCAAQTGGASGCGAAASNSSPFNDQVNLPAGATVVYEVIADTAPGASGDLVNSASVGTPNGVEDLNPDNDSSTDTDSAMPVVELSISRLMARPALPQACP